jgi:integrase
VRGRPSLPLGKHGDIWTRRDGKLFVAFCYFRDMDGATRRVKASAATAQAARNRLQDRISNRVVGGAGTVTADSTVTELGEAWFASLETSQATKDVYRQKMDRHIFPAMGAVRLREVTVGQVEAFLMLKRGTPTIAKQCRQVLSLMFAMAARLDAVESNMVRDTTSVKRAAGKGKAMTLEDLDAFRAHVKAWCDADPRRGDYLVDMTDLFVATGLRPGELIGLLWSDFDFKARTVTVSGTVKRDSVNGLHRQPYPKSEAGERTLVLPEFVWPMLAARKLATGGKAVFPARGGGWRELANVRRAWREARGETWADVKPKDFRTAVATIIAAESGSEAAAGQLGHASDAVTKKYYIKAVPKTQDNSAVLGRKTNGG